MQAPFSRTLFDLPDEQASRHPARGAVICGDQALTYGDLAARARQAASVLRDAGAGRGDRMGLLINNRTEWLELAFGA